MELPATPATDRVALVYQVSRDITRISPKPGYDVSVMVGAQQTQAYISASDGSETVVMSMVPPTEKQKIVVLRHEDGRVDVIYEAL